MPWHFLNLYARNTHCLWFGKEGICFIISDSNLWKEVHLFCSSRWMMSVPFKIRMGGKYICILCLWHEQIKYLLMVQNVMFYKCTKDNKLRWQWANRTQKTMNKWDSKGNRTWNNNHHTAKVFCVVYLMKHSYITTNRKDHNIFIILQCLW